ncbi:MAG: hypothetical protein HFJ47_01600 [Clostridia bacterium]|nr:hypothetical protein [Clostridia bacterium]
MRQRIVERKRIGKGKSMITSYNGFSDYLFSNCLTGLIILPFYLIYLMFKYVIFGTYLLVKKIYLFIKNKINDTNNNE